MNQETMETEMQIFTEKMMKICEKLVCQMKEYFEPEAVEAHVTGSFSKGKNDALSDIDIWITFDDDKIAQAIENRMETYSKFGKIVVVHEMQNNFPLNGIQSGVIFEIEEELVRVDFDLCPLSSSIKPEHAKTLFEKQSIPVAPIIYETKRSPRDSSDRVSFLISMCFNGIKKVTRNNEDFINFLVIEFGKLREQFPELPQVSGEMSFTTIKEMLGVLETVSNTEQKEAILQIETFLKKVEGLY